MKRAKKIGKIAAVALLASPLAYMVNMGNYSTHKRIGERSPTRVVNSASQGFGKENEVLRQKLTEAQVRTEELEREIQKLKSRHLGEEVLLVSASVTKETSELDVRPERNADDGDIAALNPADEIELIETLERLESDFWQEEPDYQWTDEVEQALDGTFKSLHITDTWMADVQCRRTLCLVEFAHTDPKGQELLLQRLADMNPFSGGFMVKIEDSDLTPKTLVYFSRPGETNPLSF